MSRPKGFSDADALDAAMLAFWREGFDAVSYDALVADTGASRNGLYAAFGGKKALFVRALERYRAMVSALNLTPLRQGEAGLADIKALFEKFEAQLSDPDAPVGCFACAVAADPASADPAVAAALQGYFDDARDAFRAVLARARKRQEIAADSDLEALADYLLGVVQGMSALARSPARRDSAPGYARIALKALS